MNATMKRCWALLLCLCMLLGTLPTSALAAAVDNRAKITEIGEQDADDDAAEAITDGNEEDDPASAGKLEEFGFPKQTQPADDPVESEPPDQFEAPEDDAYPAFDGVMPENTYYSIYYDSTGLGEIDAYDVKAGTAHQIQSGAALGFSLSGLSVQSWNTALDGSGRTYSVGEIITPSSDLYLYAVWGSGNSGQMDRISTSSKDTGVVVTYSSNGGSFPGSQTSVTFNGVSTDVLYTVANPTTLGLTRPGYRFIGWNAEPDGFGQMYAADSVISLSESIILFAIWAYEQSGIHTVVYDGVLGTFSNGGTSIIETVTKGQQYTVQSHTALGLTRPESEFLGWYSEVRGGGTKYNVGDVITITGDVWLYANWRFTGQSNVLAIVYFANTHDMDYTHEIDNRTRDEICEIGSCNFTRNGYIFAGWNTEKDGTGTAYQPGDMVQMKTPLALYAQWRVADVTLAYNANGAHIGTAPASQTHTVDTTVTVESHGDLRRYGYDFAGWNTAANGSGTTYQAGNTFQITEDTTLYARWTADTSGPYRVTYNGNGASAGSPPVDSASYLKWQTAPVLGNSGNLIKVGYRFAGWSTNASATVAEFSEGDTITMIGNVTLYAVWSADGNTYKVTYNGNGATDGAAPVDTNMYSYNALVSVRGRGELYRPGYRFLGWSTNASATTAQYAVGDTFRITANTTLYAVWSYDNGTTYRVTYNANGASGGAVPTDSEQYLYEALVTVLGQGSLYRTGYRFLGWSKSASATVADYILGGTFRITDNTTLYAVWSVDSGTYSVTYHGNGATAGNPPVDANTYAYNALVSVRGRGELYRPGYRFLGWSTNSGATVAQYTAGDTFRITDNTTLYAVWSHDGGTTYKVTYDKNGALVGNAPVDNTNYLYEDLVTVLDRGELYRPGYRFLGWSKSASATTADYIAGGTFRITDNTTLYAVWSYDNGTTYKVTYNKNGAASGDAPVDSNSYSYEALVTVLGRGELYRPGFRFLGWSTNASATTAQYVAGDTFRITSNVTLYAVWSSEGGSTFKVTYNKNGATVGDAPVDATSYQYEALVTVLGRGELYRPGYRFLGWSTNASATTAQYVAGNTFRITLNVTLYAVWSYDGGSTYKVTYDKNGATVGDAPVDTIAYLYEDLVTVLGRGELYRPGYRFLGWSTNHAATTAQYVAGDTFRITANTILYAVWSHDGGTTYSVTYDANGASGGIPPSDSTAYLYEALATVLGQGSLYKTGYRFLGWSTSASATAEQYTYGDTFRITANTVLYAVWSTDSGTYSVTYDKNGATVGNAPVDATSYTYNDLVTVLDRGEMYRPGFRFLGWSTTQAAVTAQYVANDTFRISSNTTLYAVWSYDNGATYTVTYDKNGALVGNAPVDANNYLYEGLVTVLDRGELYRPGYRFLGWSRNASATAADYIAGDTFRITANTILYAVWSYDNGTTYSVTYDANGASGGIAPTDSDAYLYEALVTVLGRGTLYKIGYRFLGWSKSASATTADYVESDTFRITANTTLYAVWSDDSSSNYHVTYDKNGATDGNAPIDANAYAYNATVAVLGRGELYRPGYRFVGWNKSASATTAQYAAGDTFQITENTTLYAVWSYDDGTTYSVTYDKNGATDGDAPVDTGAYLYEALVTVLGRGELYRPGYRFLGWSKSASATTAQYAAGDTFRITENTTLYAVWSHDNDATYSVTYDKNGATDGDAPVDTGAYLYEALVTVLGRGELYRPGYRFLGWSKSASATTAQYAAGDTFRITENTTLYAVWSYDNGRTYKVTYHSNGATGGTVPSDSTAYLYEDLVTVLGQGVMYRIGYRFLGWSTDVSATTADYIADDTFRITGNITLFAVWEDDTSTTYTVTYDKNGATDGDAPVDSNGYTYNSTATVLDRGELYRPGFRFLGWSTNPDATAAQYVAGDTLRVTANMTLYAVWSYDNGTTYQVTYHGNGATEGNVPVDTGTYLYEALVTVLARGALYHPGYRFLGWSTNASATVAQYVAGDTFRITGDTTLYAVWSYDGGMTYSVMYNRNGATQGSAPVDSADYLYESLVTVLGRGDMYRPGYRFLGWSTNKNATAAQYVAGDTFRITADTILFAVWAHDNSEIYSVTYHNDGADGGDVPVDLNSPYLYDDLVTVLGIDPMEVDALHRIGYRLIGWSLTLGSQTVDYAFEDTFRITQNIDLYPVWEYDNGALYRVTYNRNAATGGTAPVDSNEYLYSELVTVLGNTGGMYKRGDFIFVGWNTQADGSGREYLPDDQFRIIGDITLYAVWREYDGPRYSVTYESNNGENKSYTDDALTPIDPYYILNANSTDMVWSNYRVDVWNTEKDGSGITFLPGDRITIDPVKYADIIEDGNITLYALWTYTGSERYDFTYSPGSGSFDGSAQLVFSGLKTHERIVIATPEELGISKGGFEFVSWNTEEDGTGDSYLPGDEYVIGEESVTLYAQWIYTGEYLTITYDSNGLGISAVDDAIPDEDYTILTMEQLGFPKLGGVLVITQWTDQYGNIYHSGDVINPTENLTLKATWGVG